MDKFYTSPSPIVPEDPDDPRWPESREERCAQYERWYSLFWKLDVIHKAHHHARRDVERARSKS